MPDTDSSPTGSSQASSLSDESKSLRRSHQELETTAYTDHLDGALRWYARRAITVGGILGGIISLVTLLIGYETLAEFRVQNQQLIVQNDFLREQSLLAQQSTNASALSQLIKDIESEHDRLRLPDSVVWQPSRPLQYRIASVSRALTPYRVRADDASAWSPERALLLRILLDLSANASVEPSATFERADLRGVLFEGKNLSGLDLSGANLEGATFIRSTLDNVVFDEATLTDAKVIDVSLDRASFVDANLHNAAFWESDLTTANLDGAQLQSALLDQSLLPGVDGATNTWTERQATREGIVEAGKSPIGAVVMKRVGKTICDAQSLVLAQLSGPARMYVCNECPSLFGAARLYAENDMRRCEVSAVNDMQASTNEAR